MAERRPLVAGINQPTPPVDPNLEKDFVFGAKARGGADPSTTSPASPTVSRSPISTRIRTDFAIALKRASLERQLENKEPSTLQDILEQAIEPWLKSHGYLS